MTATNHPLDEATMRWTADAIADAIEEIEEDYFKYYPLSIQDLCVQIARNFGVMKRGE